MGSTKQSIEIAVPSDQVWQTVRNFHDMSWAPNVITGVEKVGDQSGDEPGAGRILNGAFHETLMTLDDAGKTLTYSIDDGPSPVSKDDVKDYVGTVSVRQGAAADSSVVEWTSSWQDNDEAAQEFCHAIYVALLGDLKKSLE